MLAHLGANKTIGYLRDHTWWKDMVSDMKVYCEMCHICKTSKPSNQKPYGLLNPLTIPTYPVGVDFVGPLPESGNRDGIYNSLTVMICLLTSMVHLIPSWINYNATQLAKIMFKHIYKAHGLPKNIISNQDILFTSVFWSWLHNLIRSRLQMLNAYHLQIDGATERANRMITQMCIHPNQKDWVTKLLAIEFAINSARSASTGYALFFLNFGWMPQSMIWNDAHLMSSLLYKTLHCKRRWPWWRLMITGCKGEADMEHQQKKTGCKIQKLGIPVIWEYQILEGAGL